MDFYRSRELSCQYPPGCPGLRSSQVRDAEPAVPQDPVELKVLDPSALRQGQAVVRGGHGESL